MKTNLLKNVKRVVIKVGSRILTQEDGSIDKKELSSLAKQITALVKRDIEVILVSSGAVAAGRNKLNLKDKLKTLPEKQAAAAIGQSELMKIYNYYFNKNNLFTGQILLTYSDLKDKQRYLNACNTIEKLLSYRIVPIINENDTVSTDEIKFGDNDKLSALVTTLLRADLLLILSNVDGLYARSEKDEKQKVIREVKTIDQNIKQLIYKTDHWATTGGMESKLAAAKIVTSAGEPVIIANGRKRNIILDIFKGKEIGTIFLPQQKKRMESRKRWIAFSSHPQGEIIVDEGAEKALKTKGKSLLPSGITDINGSVKAGDTVRILNKKKEEFARGLVNYSSQDISKIKGFKTSEIEKLLGARNYDEVIHRDNLVLL